MSRYLIIVEETPSGYSAYSPDVPGCVAAASTRSEVEREMQDATEFHVEGLVQPARNSRPRSASYCDVAVLPGSCQNRTNPFMGRTAVTRITPVNKYD